MDPRAAKRNLLALSLLALGLLQMVGHLVGSKAMRGLGAVTAASPFPKVFSDVDGLETFATEFKLQYETIQGEAVEKTITPDMYHRLKGPYNLRNVYGAALSYGPRLPREIWETVFCYGLREGSDFRRQLGIPPGAGQVRVVIREKTRGRNNTWVLKPCCKK